MPQPLFLSQGRFQNTADPEKYFNFSGQRCIQNYNSYEANNTAYMTLRANPETTIRPLNSSHCNGQGYPDFAGNLIDETQ